MKALGQGINISTAPAKRPQVQPRTADKPKEECPSPKGASLPAPVLPYNTSKTSTRQERLLECLQCPVCGSADWERDGALGLTALGCRTCGEQFPLEGATPLMLPEKRRTELASSVADWNDQAIIPPISYRLLTTIMSPQVHRSVDEDGMCRELLEGLGPDAVVVDIGCGAARLDERVYRLDIGAFPEVDVAGDAAALPFRDASLDGVIFHRVLEHVPDPLHVARELQRVVRPGGFISVILPFMEPFHLNPVDHMRFGRDATRHLFRDCEEERLTISAGPSAALIWMLKEYFAILCPGSNHRYVYAAVRELTGWLFYPLLWLDRFLKRKRFAHKIACEFWYVGRVRA